MFDFALFPDGSMHRDDFIRRIDESGLESTAQFLRHANFDSVNITADELASELVRECQLTSYQANVLLGESTDLLRFGNYLILEKIGQGGMGVIFKARKLCADSKDADANLVALKVLPQRTTRNAEAIKRFTREAEIATKLVHPNIVRAIEFGEIEDRHYFAMEYVDGHDVAEVIKQRGSGLALLTAFEYLRDAANGLAYAHSQNVIHRDIKPSNMLVNRKGSLKILDMGVARAVIDQSSDSDISAETDLTMTGTLLGTTGYMAPEQALNSKNADHRADLYSLGCTFYYFLFGRDIYGGETMVERIVAHREEAVPKLNELRDDIPTAVQNMFERMVAKDVECRYEDATELVEDIEDCFKEFGHMWMIQRYLQEKKGKSHRMSS